MIETEYYPCFFCGTAVKTQWQENGGGMLRGDNVLVVDWVIHTSCWKMIIRENPPEALSTALCKDNLNIFLKENDNND